MNNFKFYNPTQIVFGQNTLNQLGDLVPQTARVLILLGGRSAQQNGTLAEVQQALGKRVMMTFSGIEPNPSYEILMEAVQLIRAEKLDYLLAVGGGSVIDGTKFIAAAVPYSGEPWDILETSGITIQKALPFGCVLTLPATGSEMNNGAVITRKATQDKLVFSSDWVYPQFSILDPTKTYSLPPSQVANGIVDAFVHIIEQYLTYPNAAPVQDRFAEGLLLTLIEISPKLMAEANDYESRANFMWVATNALNGLIGVGVPHDWATHMIGHELTALYGIDHARTLAVILPALLRVQRDQKQVKLLQYASRVWGVTQGAEQLRIDQAIQHTQDFFESLGMPTRLSAYNLGIEAVDAVVGQLEKHHLGALGELQNISFSVSRRILEGAL